MDIGSGLTIQTHTVDGKPTTGIFLNTGKNPKDKSRMKYPIRSKISASEKPQNAMNATMNAARTETSKTVEAKSGVKPKRKNQQLHGGKSTNSTGPEEKTRTTEKEGRGKPQKTRAIAPQAKKAISKAESKENIEDTNTKYVTLTQGQLNTILSLVKSKNEVDVSNVLQEKKDKENSDVGTKDEEKKTDDEKEKLEANDGKKVSSRPTSGNVSSEKEESIANLLKKNPKTDEKNSKPEKKLPDKEKNEEKSTSSSGRQSQEDLPAAIRSSFFLGEAAPREHAFSAKKREQQKKWREELDKQRTEQKQKKEQERNARMKSEEHDSWTRHFDTMLPVKTSPRHDEGRTLDKKMQEEFPPVSDTSQAKKSGEQTASVNSNNYTSDSIIPSVDASGPMPSAGNLQIEKDFAATLSNNAIPQRSSYLRTMTSLLDPAQIEALEVKRQKQDEHRRAIEAQVQERKRKKEEEEERRQRLEAEEDQRLAAERDSQAQKNEIEKLRHQMQENMREQKTRELYQQMKDAQESALREKLSRREQTLRNKGHDTSRLEKTHQLTLETTRKVTENPLAQTSQTSIASMSSGVSTLILPQDIGNDLTPRQVAAVGGQGAPVAVTAQTEQGPIKLEISLNRKSQNELVESSVQTEGVFGDARQLQTHGYDSDADTEYMKLPPKKRNVREKESKGKSVKLRDFERDLEQQYERHSRMERNADGKVKTKKNEKRPKWGVGEKNKTFIPASQRYTIEQQKHDVILRKRDERQGEGERSKGTSRLPPKNISAAEQHPRPKSPVVPAVRNRQRRDPPKRPPNMRVNERPSSGIFATSEQAKYRSEKHTRHSPVPETKDFVEYRRTTAVLDPNQAQSRPETGPMESRTEFVQRQDRPLHVAGGNVDPLLNPDLLRQHERQEQILREISILRQGLLIKQREVASYPAAMTHSMAVLPATGVAPTNLVLAGGGNLPERTNDTPA